jgi:hypothetical protein
MRPPGAQAREQQEHAGAHLEQSEQRRVVEPQHLHDRLAEGAVELAADHGDDAEGQQASAGEQDQQLADRERALGRDLLGPRRGRRHRVDVGAATIVGPPLVTDDAAVVTDHVPVHRAGVVTDHGAVVTDHVPVHRADHAAVVTNHALVRAGAVDVPPVVIERTRVASGVAVVGAPLPVDDVVVLVGGMSVPQQGFPPWVIEKRSRCARAANARAPPARHRSNTWSSADVPRPSASHATRSGVKQAIPAASAAASVPSSRSASTSL